MMEITGPYNVILLALIWEKQAWTYPTNTFNKTPRDRQSSRGMYIWNLKSSGRNKNNQRDKNTRQSAQSEKNSSRQCYAVGLVAPGCLSDRFKARQPSSIQSVQQLSSQALISTGEKGTREWQKGEVTWWMVPDRRLNWLNSHQMNFFPKTKDLFHLSFWERAHRQCLESRGVFQNLGRWLMSQISPLLIEELVTVKGFLLVQGPTHHWPVVSSEYN